MINNLAQIIIPRMYFILKNTMYIMMLRAKVVIENYFLCLTFFIMLLKSMWLTEHIG